MPQHFWELNTVTFQFLLVCTYLRIYSTTRSENLTLTTFWSMTCRLESKILHATRALAHLLTSLQTSNMTMKQKNAIIYFLWTRNQKGDIKGMSRIRQSWIYVKGHLWQHTVYKVLYFSHGFFLMQVLPLMRGRGEYLILKNN